VLASLVVAGACAPPETRNVLFIVVDTLRWDRLASYGHHRVTSPHLDALAEEGVRFEYAYATAPWTMPSVASMITGLYPTGHGVLTAMTGMPLSSRTLAEILRERGFRTAGVVSNHLILNRRGRGFTQGFDVYKGSESKGHDHMSTQGVTEQSLEILDQLAKRDAPFLLFVHYFDPHFNYLAHREVDFAPPRVGRLDGSQDIHQLRRMLARLSKEEIAYLMDLYDEEIHFTDAGIGRLLERLRELDLYDTTLIVVSSDHGEEFRDHGWLGHTRTLYQELVRVPMVISAPGHRSAARVVEEPVSLVSITPTILELVGIEEPGARFHGPSLAGRVRGEPGDGAPAYVLAEVGFLPPGMPQGPKRAFKKTLVGPRYKLIRDEESGALELYDLIEDPGETNNLADAKPEVRDRMLRELDAQLARAREGATQPDIKHLTEEEIETLRELGYVDAS
jgi:arylsulfatase A-like enzyme